jgi:hypothetical protein
MIKATSVIADKDNKHIIVGFDDGSFKKVDMSSSMHGEVGKPLHNPIHFSHVYVREGAVEWATGMDACPDYLYEVGVNVQRIEVYSRFQSEISYIYIDSDGSDYEDSMKEQGFEKIDFDANCEFFMDVIIYKNYKKRISIVQVWDVNCCLIEMAVKSTQDLLNLLHMASEIMKNFWISYDSKRRFLNEE